MAKLITRQISTFSPANLEEGVHVLFSAHGVPQSYIKAGDPYKAQMEECVKLISQEVRAQLIDDERRPSGIDGRVGRALSGSFGAVLSEDDAQSGSCLPVPVQPVQFHLSFQSRVGPIKWLEPYTEDMLKELGKRKGVKNLIVVPVSFVSEHIETLEEIDLEYRHLAEESGITNWRRAAALNTDEDFLRDLTDLVVS